MLVSEGRSTGQDRSSESSVVLVRSLRIRHGRGGLQLADRSKRHSEENRTDETDEPRRLRHPVFRIIGELFVLAALPGRKLAAVAGAGGNGHQPRAGRFDLVE